MAFGALTFVGNNATDQGGALYVQGTVALNQTLCARENTAGVAGALASVSAGATLQFDGATGTQNNDSSSDAGGDVFAQGTVSCKSTPGAWQAGTYKITGDVCACAQDFVQGTNNTCNSCKFGFDANTCACAVPGSISVLPRHAVINCEVTLRVVAKVLSTSNTRLPGVLVSFTVYVFDEGVHTAAAAIAALVAGGAGDDDDEGGATRFTGAWQGVTVVAEEGQSNTAASEAAQQLQQQQQQQQDQEPPSTAAGASGGDGRHRKLARIVQVKRTDARGEAAVYVSSRAPAKLVVVASVDPGTGGQLLTAAAHIRVAGDGDGPHMHHGHDRHGRPGYGGRDY